eukprot:m.13294 g.13294  ORF g.13294 m.13294 type:complete len:1306 (+) comp5928_c0_seq1:189-4106(+)
MRRTYRMLAIRIQACWVFVIVWLLCTNVTAQIADGSSSGELKTVTISGCSERSFYLDINQTHLWLSQPPHSQGVDADLELTNLEDVGWCTSSATQNHGLALGQMAVNGDAWKPSLDRSKPIHVSTAFQLTWDVSQADFAEGLGLTRPEYSRMVSEEDYLRAHVLAQPSASNDWTARVFVFYGGHGANLELTIHLLTNQTEHVFDHSQGTRWAPATSFHPFNIYNHLCIDQPCVLGASGVVASCACFCTSTPTLSVDCRARHSDILPARRFIPRNVTVLDVGHNPFQHIPCGWFEDFPLLSTLHISKTHLHYLEHCMFTGLSRLTELHMETNNHLKWMAPGPFRSLTQLQRLDLSHNGRPLGDLMTVNGSVLVGLRSLEEFNCVYCYWFEIQKDTFTGAPSLARIVLAPFQVPVIHREAFATLTKLQQVDLTGCAWSAASKSLSCVCLPGITSSDNYLCDPMCSLPATAVLTGPNTPPPYIPIGGTVFTKCSVHDTFNAVGQWTCMENGQWGIADYCDLPNCDCTASHVECTGIALPDVIPPFSPHVIAAQFEFSCGLSTLSQRTLRGVSHVSRFRSRYFHIPSVEGTPFIEFNQMTILSFDAPQLIRHFPEDMMLGASSLFEFSLRNHAINTPDTFFHHLPNIRELRLQFGHLEHITSNTFSKNPYVTEIRLDSNNIQSIAPDAFVNNPNLRILRVGLGFELALSSPIDPTFLDHLLNVEELAVWDLGLEAVPDAIRNMAMLRSLELGGNIDLLRPSMFPQETTLAKLQIMSPTLASLAPGIVSRHMDILEVVADRDTRGFSCKLRFEANGTSVPFCECPFEGQVNGLSCLPDCTDGQLFELTNGCVSDFDCLLPCASSDSQAGRNATTPANPMPLAKAMASCTLQPTPQSFFNCSGDVPVSLSPVQSQPTTTTPAAGRGTQRKVIFGALFPLLVIMFIVILVVVAVRRRQHRNTKVAMSLAAASVHRQMANLLITKYPEVAGKGVLKQDPPILPQQCVDFGLNKVQLGGGNFASVFQATLQPGWQQHVKSSQAVAVKVAEGQELEDVVVSAVLEAQLMYNLAHPNIVRVLGVLWLGTSFCTVVELMDGGDLLSFMRKAASPMSAGVALQVLRDIAQACAYLVRHGIVHRDISARNCGLLLGTPDNAACMHAKLLDFGLSRLVGDQGEYVTRTRGRGKPIRWMAPESLSEDIYSEQSDVWSFGVLCWEVLTNGKQPWEGYQNGEVVRFVVQEEMHLKRPAQDETCSPSNTDAMWMFTTSCWQHDPPSRPTFANIVTELQGLDSTSPKQHIQLSLGDADESAETYL